MNNGLELYSQLRQYIGGDTVYHHSLVKSFLYTSGVRDFAKNAGGGAYWLLDILATEPAIAKLVVETGFAVVTLNVTGSTALLTVAADSGEPPVFSSNIPFTDCPEAPVTPLDTDGSWKFYIEVTGCVTSDRRPQIMLLLPQEH